MGAADILSTTVIGSLPGETGVDPRLLDDLVAAIRAASHDGGLEGALAVADVVLSRLFRGDLEAFRRSSRTHETFRALQAHPDLGMSRSALWYALAVREQITALPPAVALALPLAHHKVLLTVDGTVEKVALAERAVRENLSRRDLERIVRNQTPASVVRKAGRPPLPAFVKGLRRVDQAVDLATSEPLSPRELRRLGRDDVKGLLRSIERNLTALDRLKAELERLNRER